MEQTRLRYAKLYDPGRAHTVLIGSFMIMANDWLALLGIGLFGILIALPFVGIISLAGGLPLSGFDHWPRTLQYLSLGLMIFFGCSFYLTNMPLTLYFFPDSHYSGMREPFSKLRWWIQSMKTLICQVPAGWMFNRGLIQQSLANYIYTYAIARIAFDAANFSFWEGVLSGALAGIFLGQNFWKIPVDPYIEELSIAGQIRCLLRLRRWYRARENIFMLSKYSIFPPLQTCTYALGEYFFVVNPGWPREYRAEKLSNAKEIVADIGEWNYPFHSLWNESIRNIRILINESGDKIE